MAIQLESSGEVDQALCIYEQLINVELPEVYSVELKLRYAKILKQTGRFDHAADVLNSGEELNDLRVLIQLAKVLEHQRRDYAKALEATERALEVLRNGTSGALVPTFTQNSIDLEKRRERLLVKLKSGNGREHE